MSQEKSGLLGSAGWSMSLGAHRVKKPCTETTLGRFIEPGEDNGKFFYQSGHVLTCAPSGAGKGVGAVIPNLIEYGGSIFCVDIKGENYAVTHATRKNLHGSNVVLIDPFNFTEQDERDSYNVFSWLSQFPEELTSDSEMIADAFVVADSSSENSFWDDSAKNLIRGVVAYISTYSADKMPRRNIGELRRIVTLSSADFMAVLRDMADSKISVVERCANSLLAMDEKTRSGVLTTAQQHTAFLDEPRIVDTLSASTFDLEKFKSGNMSIYLVMPPEKLSNNFRLVRLIISLLITSVTRMKGKPEIPALFLFDEFAQLGKMTIIEDTLSLIRGYGAYYWFIIQDLSQLKAVYKKWQTFLSNTTKQFFATSDYDTAKYISDSLGQTTIQFSTAGESENSSLGLRSGSSSSGSSSSEHLQARNLLNPDEVMGLPADVVIVLNRGEKPFRLLRLNYLNDPEYRGYYAQNPMHV
jgi:type IV secretion system protein VirD4